MNEAKAGSAGACGQGGVTRANKCYAAGGTISGKGQIIRKNGEIVDFELTSDPLTTEQAGNLNEKAGASLQE